MLRKWSTLKKSSFIEGTFIATLAIVLVKIMGMLYVIPFYAIVGTTGAALYSYAYNIYLKSGYNTVKLSCYSANELAINGKKATHA